MPYMLKLPVEIRAFRLGEKGKPTPAPAWFGSPHPSRVTDFGIILATSRGDVLAPWGHWVVMDQQGDLSAYSPEAFAAKYEWRDAVKGPVRET